MQDDQNSDVTTQSESSIAPESSVGSDSSVETESNSLSQNRAVAGLPTEPLPTTEGHPQGFGIGSNSGPPQQPDWTDSAASVPIAEERPFQTLDYRVIHVWRLAAVFAFGVICLAVLIGSVLLWTLSPVPKFVFPIAWLITCGLVYLSVVWLPRRQYDRWSYRVDERILELRYGIVWQVSVLVPFSRLQHVDLHRGPLERNYGLTTLEIHTAGTRDASHKLPGLPADTAERLRDELIQAANLKVE